eukprot:7279436-Prymnesium_polylepis.1
MERTKPTLSEIFFPETQEQLLQMPMKPLLDLYEGSFKTMRKMFASGRATVNEQYQEQFNKLEERFLEAEKVTQIAGERRETALQNLLKSDKR